MNKFTETAKQAMGKALYRAANRIKSGKSDYICYALDDVLESVQEVQLYLFLCHWIEKNLKGEITYLRWALKFGQGWDNVLSERLRWIDWMIAQIEGQECSGEGLPTSVSFAEVETAWFSSPKRSGKTLELTKELYND